MHMEVPTQTNKKNAQWKSIVGSRHRLPVCRAVFSALTHKCCYTLCTQSDGVVGKHLHFGDHSPKWECAIVHPPVLRVFRQHLLGHVGGAGMGTALKTLVYGTLGFLAFVTFVEPKQLEAMFATAVVKYRCHFWRRI